MCLNPKMKQMKSDGRAIEHYASLSRGMKIMTKERGQLERAGWMVRSSGRTVSVNTATVRGGGVGVPEAKQLLWSSPAFSTSSPCWGVYGAVPSAGNTEYLGDTYAASSKRRILHVIIPY